jgi:hypothetical protein
MQLAISALLLQHAPLFSIPAHPSRVSQQVLAKTESTAKMRAYGLPMQALIPIAMLISSSMDDGSSRLMRPASVIA